MKKLWLSTVILMGALQADEGVQEVEQISTYDHRINFSFSRLGYERLKANDVYVGVQEWFVPFLLKKGSDLDWMNEIEGRVGYNFCFGNQDRLTPMVGGGYFRYHSHDNAQGVGYGMAGVAYEHSFNQLFAMGLNLKGTLGSSVSSKGSEWENPIWGYQVDAPIIFRFGKGRKWDYHLVPFVVGMHGKNGGVFTYGFFGEVGYRF